MFQGTAGGKARFAPRRWLMEAGFASCALREPRVAGKTEAAHNQAAKSEYDICDLTCNFLQLSVQRILMPNSFNMRRKRPWLDGISC